MLVPGERVDPSSSAIADDLISFGEDPEPVARPSDLPGSIGANSPPSAPNTPTRHHDINSEPSPASDSIDPDLPELLDWSRYRNQACGTDEKETAGPPADPEPPPLSSSTPAQKSASSGTEDDLGDLLKDFAKTPVAKEKEKPATRDPFQFDPDASLRIDGISPEENEFRVVCNICGSLMYARPSQIGSHIKCHDCYTPVLVQAPREVPENTARSGEPFSSSRGRDNDDSGPDYSLKPIEDIGPIDTTIDRSLEPIDFDDDEFFRQKKELEEALSMQQPAEVGQDIVLEMPGDLPAADTGTASPSPSEAVDAEEYRLTASDEPEARKPSTPVTFDDLDDLLGSQPQAAQISSPDGTADSRGSGEKKTLPLAETPVRVVPVEEQDSRTERTGKAAPAVARQHPGSPTTRTAGKREELSERSSAQQKTSSGDSGGEPKKQGSEALRARWERQNQKSLPADDIGSPVANLGNWLLSSLKVATRVDNLVRLAIAAILLGFGNIVLFGGLDRILAEEPSVISRITGGFMIAFGAIPMLVAWLAVIAHSNSIIMNAVEGTNEAEEGLDLSPSEWFARLIFVAPSFFAGSLPGFVLGQAIFIGGGSFLWVIVLGILSGIMITPVFIASAMYHSSPWQLFHGGILGAFMRLPWRVIRFAVIGMFVASAIAACLYAAKLGVVAAFVFPALAVLFAFAAWWMMGDLIGVTLRQAEKTAAEQTASGKQSGR